MSYSTIKSHAIILNQTYFEQNSACGRSLNRYQGAALNPNPNTQALHLGRAASTCSLFDIQLQCRDTYWVESFNNVILIYCPKRIHFADRTFNMRISLAVLDWVSSM